MAGKHELHQKGLRLTPQRELVLAAVRQLGHATPEEVAEKVRSTHPGINLSTVYRNLGEMPYARTFGDVPEGAPLLYLNSLMNVSFALNQGDFVKAHGVACGADWSVRVERSPK